jgi:hypothetical protein
MNKETLDALAMFPYRLAANYALIPQTHRHWAPPSWDGVPSEPLTAIEQLCHIRDIEIDGYHRRFHRTLAEVNPALGAIDTAALARERSYGTANADLVLEDFRQARAQTVALISGLSSVQLARTAVFEGYGAVTVRSLVHYLCSHDQQHLAGLQWLLGKIAGIG